ncbi:DNA-binding CsgD family transcriptional regulator [Paenibacillus sp. PastF-3]|uniref:response regulator transcription factor n=1 Tax=unclassified Paenibacillus TaxID=185978 RepID=UPI000BA02965|nr:MULTISPECIES: helix-turn-helix transcriptional regulator [unclassified Paenibacillus]MDH6372930.1 DNA-binding CsgD family transcriptional regulator [Paenibacillus sp. PastF-3]OZQ77339.1 hypothetical protein CA598_29860 [Paenibacillus sp. VTT E-133291]
MTSNEVIRKALEEPMFRCELKERQREVLWLTLEGKARREIAAIMFMTEVNVQKHLQHIYMKLGIEGKTQLARWVIDTLGSTLFVTPTITTDQFVQIAERALANRR